MAEPEPTPSLTLDELLALAGGADAPRADDAARPVEDDSDDMLLRLFGTSNDEPASAEQPPAPEPRTTPAATLASLFGMADEHDSAPAPVHDDAPAAETPSFDLFAAFGASLPDGQGADAPASTSARGRIDEPAASQPFNLASALGATPAEPVEPARSVAPPRPREEPRPLRGRFVDLGTRVKKPEPKPAMQPELKPEPKPEPKPMARPEPKPEPKPATRPEPKPEPKLATRPEPKPESKPMTRSESKPEPQPDMQPEARPVPQRAALAQPALAPASETSPEDVVRTARAAFDSRVARKRLPARTEAPAAKPEPPIAQASADERPAEDAAQALALPAQGPELPVAPTSDALSVQTPAAKQPAVPTPPAVSAPAPATREAPAYAPVNPVVPSARHVPADPVADEAPDGDGHRKLLFAGIALVAVAALAGSFALAIALDGGAAAVRGESTPLALAAGGSPHQGPGAVEYRYKVKGSAAGMGQATERALFGDDGFLDRSEIAVSLADEEDAQAFLDDARIAFGDALVEGSSTGALVELIVAAQGEPVDQATYTELLKRDTVDCEVVSR